MFGTISQAGNADNLLRVEDLRQNEHSYSLWIEPANGKLLSGNQDENEFNVSIPRTVLEDGYQECSKFAENFNAQLAENFGIHLVDETVLEKMKDMVIPLPQADLPVIEHGGFRFEVDISLREVRNIESPFVHVNLDLLAVEHGRYVAYIFDEGRLSSSYMKGATKLEFDQLVKLAPEEVSKLYGITKEMLPEHDRQLRSNPTFLQDRIEKGKLPIIRIVDEDYFVDTRLHELRSCNKFWKTISLPGDFKSSFLNKWQDTDDKQVFLYDYLERKVIDNYNGLTEIPKHSLFIVLPDIRALDPVSAGRKINNDPYSLLDKYPIQPFMEARLVPIEKTYLAERIKRNKEQQLRTNDKIIRPPKKNSKNKGQSF